MSNVQFVPIGNEPNIRHVLLVDDIPVARMQWANDVPEERQRALEAAETLFGICGTLEPLR